MQVTNTHEYSAFRAVNINLISAKTDNIIFKLSVSMKNIWFYS